MGSLNKGKHIAGRIKKRLTAAVRLLFDPRAAGVRKWGCSKCKGEEFAHGDQFRDSRNCDGNGRRVYLEYDPDVSQCPWAFITQETNVWVNLWQDFDRWRVLPWGGSDLMEYPAYFYEAFHTCESAKVAVMNEANERQEKKAHDDLRKQRLQSKGI